MFTNGEICDAAVGFLHPRIGGLTQTSQPKVERISEGSVVISFQKNDVGTRDRHVIPAHELADALIRWSRSKGMTLPMSGAKKIQKLGTVLCLRVATNIRDGSIDSIERLIMRDNERQGGRR